MFQLGTDGVPVHGNVHQHMEDAGRDNGQRRRLRVCRPLLPDSAHRRHVLDAHHSHQGSGFPTGTHLR